MLVCAIVRSFDFAQDFGSRLGRRENASSSNPTLSASPFAFNRLDAVNTVVHTAKPILGAVCDAIPNLRNR